MKNRAFQSDLFRCYGEKGESLRDRLLRPIKLKYMYAFRMAQASTNVISRTWYRLRLRRLSLISKIQIPITTRIGEGFYIGHTGRVLINADCVIGKNVNVATGVTIGQENRGAREGVPTLGDRVWVGTNAVIVGKVNIGSDVLIAPLSFVNFDVPDHSIVIGNPGRIIPAENATESYITKTV